MSSFDDMTDEYQVAASVSQTDFSQLGIDDFANVEFDSDGAPYGMVMGVPVAINQPAPAPQIEAPVVDQPENEPSLIEAMAERGREQATASLNIGAGVLDGINTAAMELLETTRLSKVADWLDSKIPLSIDYEKPTSVEGTLGSGVGQVGAGMIPAARMTKALGAVSKFLRWTVAGALTDFAFFDPDDSGLGDLARDLGEVDNETLEQMRLLIADSFAKNEDDGELEKRLKTVGEGVVAGATIDSLILLYRGARGLKNGGADRLTQVLIDAGVDVGEGLQKAVRGVDQALDRGVEMMGGGDTLGMGVGPVPKAAEAATDIDEQGFFSAMSRAVDALPMDKGTGDQMRAMIAKGEGVKAEEMAWTGLDDFLAGKQSVTKQEVRDYVDANQVQVEEVVRADEGVTQNVSYLRRRYEMMVEGSGDYADLPPSLREERAEKMLADIEAMEADNVAGPTKFGEYTLPGGENYREVVLTLPETRSSTISNAELARLDELTDKRIADSLDGLTDAERDEYISLVGKREDKGQFRGPHYDEPNVLAHIRLNDRTGPNGERILFIEEIQSDWHQKGRKQGYKKETSNLDRELDFVEKQLDELAPKSKANRDHIDAGGDRSELPFPDIGRDIENFMDRRSELVSEMAKFKDGVPDAPLKKNWHEMSFRRVARMAAEEGYDAIAWTPGKVQAERYDLSKQIDELRYQKNDDGTFNIVPAKDGQTIQAEEFENLAENRLVEVVGKEVAEKIVKGEGVADSGTSNAQILRGVDLQVGGEGMKGFYDKMLKNYAEKWGKKFGSKVGVTKIARDYPEMADDQKLLDDLGVEATGSPHHEVWSMPVTPKMRDSVLKKGVPLFSAAGATAATGAAMQNEKQPASERVF